MAVTDSLNLKKMELMLLGEVKWSKMTENYLEKYKELIDLFFRFIQDDKIKIRIMFTQNRNIPLGLTHEHRDEEYFLLYYQFIKHAFGLKYLPESEYNTNLRLFFDEFPETQLKIDKFRHYLLRLVNQDEFTYFDKNEISVKPKFDLKKENIAEVDSKNHVILQCLDIILGAMAFRLNDLHKKIPEGQKRRGKRTRAKELLYKHILSNIFKLRPRFNIGESTGKDDNDENIWLHPYRHWNFIPRNYTIDDSFSKGRKKKHPI